MAKSEPIELVIQKGKKHLTKEEIKTRVEGQVKAKSDNIVPPEYLNEELKEIFIKYAEQLLELEIMSNLDIGALERYVVAEYEYRFYTSQLLNCKIGPKYLKIKDLQSKAFKEARASSTDLGLNISSRVKLVVPKAEVKKENKFDRFVKK